MKATIKVYHTLSKIKILHTIQNLNNICYMFLVPFNEYIRADRFLMKQNYHNRLYRTNQRLILSALQFISIHLAFSLLNQGSVLSYSASNFQCRSYVKENAILKLLGRGGSF